MLSVVFSVSTPLSAKALEQTIQHTASLNKDEAATNEFGLLFSTAFTFVLDTLVSQVDVFVLDITKRMGCQL